MRRTLFTLIVTLFFGTILHGQKDSTFYKHELKISVGDAFGATMLWAENSDDYRKNAELYMNLNFSYFYRPVKWFWIGGNFTHYFGEKEIYRWKEIDTEGNVTNHSKSKMKYCTALSPELRFSYVNKKYISLYSALSAGICIEDGYENRYHNYPELNFFFQLTWIGVSGNFGKKANIFLGGELGLGFKGFFILHGGYRF